MEGGRSWIYDLPVERTVEGSISYFGDAPGKPTFHAKDHRRDNWRPDIWSVTFHDARGRAEPPSLRREGVAIAPHSTKVRDFGDRDEVRRTYARELEELIREVTGAGKVVGFPSANMRFSPRHQGYMDGANRRRTCRSPCATRGRSSARTSSRRTASTTRANLPG